MMDPKNSVNDPSLYYSDHNFNLFTENNLNINTTYLTSDEVKTALDKFQSKDTFSAMHVNIRSLNKNLIS